MFRVKGAWIMNEKGKVLDVSGGHDTENRNIIVHNKHNGMNQKWTIGYHDTIKPDPKKG